MPFSDIATAIALLASAVLGYLQLRHPRPKTRQENAADDAGAAKDISDAWRPVVEELRTQIHTLTEDMDMLRTNVSILYAGSQKLVDQIEKAGLAPVWRPPLSIGLDLRKRTGDK